MSHSAVRSLLLAVLVVGALGSVGPATTYSLFTNTHDGTGTVSAADNINGGTVTADSGGPYSVSESGTVELDASGSSTSKGNIRSYEWEIVTSAGSDSLSPTSGQQVTYNAPGDVSTETTAEVRVTVTNNKGATSTDTATVTVSDGTSNSCDAATLTFCSVAINDRDTSYSVPYDVGDPDGEFRNVTVTLIEEKNNPKTVATVSSQSITDTVSVSTGNGNGNGNGNTNQYTIRIELYGTNGNVACTIAKTDEPDGTDPTLSSDPCGS